MDSSESQLKAELYRNLYDSLRKDDVERFILLVNKARKDYREDFLNTSSSPENPTLLQCACNLQATKAVEALIKARVNPNYISKKIATPPIILAVEKGNVNILGLLTSHKQIQLDVMDDLESRQSVLHRVIASLGGECTTEEKSRYRQCLDLLLDTTPINANLLNGVGNSPLHEAASFGLGDVFIKLLQHGADPNMKDSAGQTALHILIDKPLRELANDEKRKRILKCVWFLFDKSHHLLDSFNPLDVNAQDEHDRTVLHLAASCGLKEVVALLLKNGADPNLKDDTGKTTLHELICSLDLSMQTEEIERYLDCLDILLQSNTGRDHEPVDLEAKCSIGFNALDYAIVSGVGEAVSKLLKNGANPNVKDDEGQTALHHVIWQLGQSRTTEELKGYGECLDSLLDPNKHISTERLDQLSYRPIYPVDVSIQDNEGDTALHLATRNGLQDAMMKLRSMMTSLRIENNRGWTVLHEIMHPRAFESCKTLKKNRSKYFDILVGGHETPNKKLPIDVNARDKEGNTLLYYAIVSRFEEAVVRLMLDGARMSPNFCRMIPPSTWETFMDSCISVPDDEEISSMNFPITFDYSRLLAPLDHDQPILSVAYVNHSRNTMSSDIESPTLASISFQTASSNNNGNVQRESDQNIRSPAHLTSQWSRIEEKRKDMMYPECETMWHLSRSSKHQILMKHPLVTSILLQKWHRVRWLYYISVLFYAVYLGVSSTFFVHTNFALPVERKLNNEMLHGFRYSLIVMSSIYLLWSIFELCVAPCVFLLRKESWMDLIVQGFTLFLALYGIESPNRDLCGLVVFLAWTEGLILLSRHPKLSMYVTMFTTVSLTFLRLLLWYSILLFAFVLSFRFLFSSAPGTENDRMQEPPPSSNKIDLFDNIPDTAMKVMVMMTGEFDFGSLPFISDTSKVMFVAFLFLITIVLYSLLNAMAVSDIRDIHDKAETLFFVNLVETFTIQESIMLGDPCKILPGLTLSCCWGSSLNPKWITNIILRRLLLFTSCPPDKKTSTFDVHSHLSHHGINPFFRILRAWKKFVYDSNYQLGKEITQMAQHKVLENRQRISMREPKNYTDIVAEMQTLKEDIQEILRLLKPSSNGPASEEQSGLNNRQTYESDRQSRRKTKPGPRRSAWGAWGKIWSKPTGFSWINNKLTYNIKHNQP